MSSGNTEFSLLLNHISFHTAEYLFTIVSHLYYQPYSWREKYGTSDT